MKIVLSILILLISPQLLPQPDTTFTELRGIDDSSAVTHLFYRKHSYWNYMGYFVKHNDVYHFNVSTQSDTLFLKDFYKFTPVSLGGISTKDFEFWNDDPSRLIVCGEYTEIDPSAYI